jgi:mono/diheme cytochrome c family protein
MMRTCHVAAALLSLCAVAASRPGIAQGFDPAEANFPGVLSMQRAWQHWTLNCQGCHRADGMGTDDTAPSLAGAVAKFLHAPGGREYLGEVPGVATSALGDADLAEVMNWMLYRFDRSHVPANFEPYAAEEIARLRLTPLHIEASKVRNKLLQQANRHLKE